MSSQLGRGYEGSAGTRCLRTLAIVAELNGVIGETDLLSLWLPVSGPNELRDLASKLASNQLALQQLGSRVTPRATEKIDEFLPDELLTKTCVIERLAVEEALVALTNVCSP